MRHHLSRAWRIFLLLLLLSALLLTAARLALQSADRFRPQVEHWLSETLEIPVQLGRLQGSWRYAFPVLRAEAISATTAVTGTAPGGQLRIDSLELELDLLGSLLEGMPIFQRFEVDGVELDWHERGGYWLHRPGAEPGQPDQGVSPAGWGQLVNLLTHQPYAVMRDVHIRLVPEQGEALLITPADLELENALNEHRLSGLFRMPELGAQAGIRFAIETDLVTPDPMKAGYRLYFQAENLGPELFRILGQEPRLQALNLNLELWASLRNQSLQNLQAEVEFDHLQLTDIGLSGVQAGHLQVAVQPREQGYQLQLQQIALQRDGTSLNLPRMIADLSWQQGRLDLKQALVPELDLASTRAWLSGVEIIPGLNELLEQLQPRGRLRQLRVAKPAGEGWDQLRLNADLEGVGVEGWHGAPALDGVNGQLYAGLKAGMIRLNSQAFDLHFPQIYPDGWHYEQAQGEIRWWLDDTGVRVSGEQLRLQNEGVNGSGRFSLAMPFDHERQSELTLLIGLTESDGGQASRYTPEKELGSGLHGWLDGAIRSGRVREAGMLLRTGTRSLKESSTPVVQLFFDVEDARLDYQSGWPAVEKGDLFLLVKNQGLSVNINRARLLGSDVLSGWAYLPPDGRQLEVETLLEGPASDIDQVLKTTPLAQQLGSELERWQLEGRARTRLGLSIPLTDSQPPDARVKVDLSQGRFGSPELGIALSEVSGQFSYTREQGFAARDISAIAWGGPVRASVVSDADRIRVDLQGETDLATLGKALEQPLLGMTTGQGHWQGALTLCEDEACPRLELSSDLVGVELPLPGVLYKPAEVSTPLNLSLDLNTPVRVRQLDLKLANRLAAQESINISGKAEAGGLRLNIAGADLQGEVFLPQDESPLKVHLQRLQLGALMPTEREDTEPESTDESGYSRLLGQGTVPAIDMRVDELWLDDLLLGDWRFKVRPDDTGVRISALEAYLDQMILSGEAHWKQGEASLTELTLKLAGDDVGALLQRWHYGRFMETSEAEALLQLNWAGAPWAVAPGKLNGELQFSTRKGRLIETSDSSNLLRVFGILNFNSLARRLRLDFSDLFKKGVSFDHLNGYYRLDRGVATTVTPLEMVGPSANLSIQGQVNLATATLDKTVEVALPVSSNVPLAAVLLGAPQVAGAVFVIDKLIGDRLERLTTLRYRLSGSWDDPALELLTRAGEKE